MSMGRCEYFASTVCDRMEENDNFLNRWVFSDDATFHLSGRVKRVSPKVNVWCRISRYKLYGPFDQFDQDRTWTCCNIFSYPSCNRTTAWILCFNSLVHLLIRPQSSVNTWMTHLMATGAVEVDQLCGLQIFQTSPHLPFFFGVLWRMMCIHSDPWTLTISKKRFAQLFKKLHLKCYITHCMQYLHDKNCVVYAMVVMLRSNLIWTKLPCFKNAYIPYWTINSYSSPFTMYSFCVFPNGSLCIIKQILVFWQHRHSNSRPPVQTYKRFNLPHAGTILLWL